MPKQIKQEASSGENFDAVIIGAGAAGLFCAYQAAKAGRQILVLESSNRAGKKILMSGGGRCNFTNLYVEADNYLCENPHFCKSALSRYTQWDFLSLVQEFNIAYHERKHGQLFCDESASDILQMLLSLCAEYGVQIKLKQSIKKLSCEQGLYKISSNKQIYQSSKLVIATGGLSIPTLGGSDFGYLIAQQFGLNLLPRRAGLVPFVFSDTVIKPLCEKLAGNAIEVGMSLLGKSDAPCFTEAMLFTHRGLSGPVVLQLSSYWQEGDSIVIDLLPHENLAEQLVTAKQQGTQLLMRRYLQSLLPKKLVLELECLFWPDKTELELNQWPDVALQQLARQLHDWVLKPAATEGYRTAEVTLGGVNTDDLSSKTMMAKKQKGLYFIGEVVDVSGHLGGFNFQWAWASAFACAQDL